MRKTLAEIYNDAFSRAWNGSRYDFDESHAIACKAVAEAVRKRVKRQIAAENRRKEMAESKWVLR